METIPRIPPEIKKRFANTKCTTNDKHTVEVVKSVKGEYENEESFALTYYAICLECSAEDEITKILDKYVAPSDDHKTVQ